MPLRWKHSLDSSTGTFEQNVKEQSQYFIETAGIKTCKKITVKTLGEADIAGCGLQSLDMGGFDPYGALDLIKSCASSKAGALSNSGNLAVIALTNHPKMAVYDPSFGSGAVQTAGFTEPGGNIIIASIKSKAVPTHELGHLFFNFCDQYKFTEFVLQDKQRKRLGIPKGKGLSPGCQNKYPGPGGGQQYQLQISQTGLAVPSNFKPGQCPDYPKCSYETGSFVTCCANDKTDYHDCSGRFIPINGQRGVSVMGSYYAGLGDSLPRTYDCFEKEAIQKQAGCKIEASTVRETGAPANALLETDSDGDGVPDSAGTEAGQEPETTRAVQYLAWGNESAYTLYFLPLKWDHSKDATGGTFEENVTKLSDFFIEKAGLAGCRNISVKLVKGKENCNFNSINFDSFVPEDAFDAVEACFGLNIGFLLNKEKSAVIALSNATTAITGAEPYGGSFNGISHVNKKLIISLIDQKAIAHELGHVLFYFCDQFNGSIYQITDLQLKAARLPKGNDLTAGCQNTYPGSTTSQSFPYGIATYRVELSENNELQVSGNPDYSLAYVDPPSCDYQKCDYEKDPFPSTCCPNLGYPNYTSQCTGRLIPMDGKIGLSLMGKTINDFTLYDFDCKEKEVIKKIAGC
jgi:hypothetical protein